MNTERQIKLVGYCPLVCHDIWWHILTNHDISWQIMTFCHKNKKLHFVAETRGYGIFVARIYYNVLIDSFWGCAGFIDSPTSSATLPLCMPQLQWTLSPRTMHVDQVAMEVMNVEEDEMGNKVKDLSLFFPRYSFFGLNFFITWPLDSRSFIALMQSIPYSLRISRHFIFKVVLL